MKNTTKKPTKTMVETIRETMPTILRVALLIAYDNGMVNRNESEDDFVGTTASILGEVPLIELIKLEAFLKTLNPIQLNIIAAGEDTESKALLADAPNPEFADTLFNRIFEGE
ncbi:hypothetical protein HYO99_gp13 [Roseobacter phage RD-1410W1-01]|uniref:Uncharacterized protein n=1 Tax=Roseobacter phage RD-1410W1-01 TaxID=1815984 RepID=A0A191VYF2_9CAUD|nr:hypothetical protein HYO99_gp13 [Roseobacter phage RD-1410W1-01]ANJ20747.1 hypothetical protein RDp01_gp13 [Roseobacter phage RD-1410W1-01]